MHPLLPAPRADCFHSSPTPTSWEATAEFSHRSQKLTRQVSHKVPPSSFIKNSSHRHASFVCYLRKAEKSHVFLPTGDSREEEWVLFPRRLGKISHGKEFNQEGFD